MRKLKTQATPTEQQMVYTLEETRAILKIGRSAIIRLCLSGEIRSLVIGRSRRITADAITQFLAGEPSGNGVGDHA